MFGSAAANLSREWRHRRTSTAGIEGEGPRWVRFVDLVMGCDARVDVR
jgi:hypothetical protein